MVFRLPHPQLWPMWPLTTELTYGTPSGTLKPGKTLNVCRPVHVTLQRRNGSNDCG